MALCCLKMKMGTLIITIGFIIGLATGNPHPKSELTMQPPSYDVVRFKNSSYIVTCNASGGAKLNWLNPAGKPISDVKGRVHVESTSALQDQKSLVFTNINQDDRGIWTCVSDSVDYNQTFKMIVNEDIYFKDTLLTQNARENSKATVQCAARGDPKPTVSWYFNGAQIAAPSAKYNKTDNGLVIGKVTRDDRGEYTCRAFQVSNYSSNVAERIISLTVQHKPISHHATAKQAYGYITGTVNLTCRAIANPAANFTWHRSGRAVAKSSGRIFEDIHISILEVPIPDRSAFGDYMCKAGNFMGTMETIITLVEGHRPDPPTEVTLRGANWDTLDIEIRGSRATVGPSTLAPQPDNLPIIGYRFQYMLAPPTIVNEVPKGTSEEGQSNEVTDFTSPATEVFEEIDEPLWANATQIDFGIEDGATFLLTGLQQNMPYVVRAMAQNPAGFSLPSATLRCHTLRLQPHSVFGAASSQQPSALLASTILLSTVALLAGILNQPAGNKRKQSRDATDSPSLLEEISRVNTLQNGRC